MNSMVLVGKEFRNYIEHEKNSRITSIELLKRNFKELKLDASTLFEKIRLGLEKMSNNSAIRVIEEEIEDYNTLGKYYDELMKIKTDILLIPSIYVQLFQELACLLPENEAIKLEEMVNLPVGEKTAEIIKNLDESYENVLHQMKRMRIDKNVIDFKNNSTYSSNDLPMDGLLYQIYSSKKSKLKTHYIINNNEMKIPELSLDYGTKELLNDMNFLFSNYTITDDNLLEMKYQYYNIVNSFMKKQSLNRIIEKINIVAFKAHEVHSIHLDAAIDYMLELKENYKKELKQTEEFLSQFDFNEIKLAVEQKKYEQEHKEENHQEHHRRRKEDSELKLTAMKMLELQGLLVGTDEEQESLIQEKMQELISLVPYTPEERGLIELKKKGIVPENMTTHDLTPNQINDFRIAYSDQALGLTDYIKKNNKKELQELRKEYIRYRGSLEDKTVLLSFSEYVESKYGYIIEQEQIANDELQEQEQTTRK